MSTVNCKLLVWAGEQSACVRVAGRANFAVSVEFRKLLQHLSGSGRRVLIDLSGCLAMDSTFLGILAFEASRLAVQLELLNANPTIRQTIEELGVAQLFSFVERDLAQESFDAAPATGESNVDELNRTCLEAHEALIALHPGNVAKFKEATHYFAEALRKKK